MKHTLMINDIFTELSEREQAQERKLDRNQQEKRGGNGRRCTVQSAMPEVSCGPASQPQKVKQ